MYIKRITYLVQVGFTQRTQSCLFPNSVIYNINRIKDKTTLHLERIRKTFEKISIPINYFFKFFNELGIELPQSQKGFLRKAYN